MDVIRVANKTSAYKVVPHHKKVTWERVGLELCLKTYKGLGLYSLDQRTLLFESKIAPHLEYVSTPVTRFIRERALAVDSPAYISHLARNSVRPLSGSSLPHSGQAGPRGPCPGRSSIACAGLPRPPVPRGCKRNWTSRMRGDPEWDARAMSGALVAAPVPPEPPSRSSRPACRRSHLADHPFPRTSGATRRTAAASAGARTPPPPPPPRPAPSTSPLTTPRPDRAARLVRSTGGRKRDMQGCVHSTRDGIRRAAGGALRRRRRRLRPVIPCVGAGSTAVRRRTGAIGTDPSTCTVKPSRACAIAVPDAPAACRTMTRLTDFGDLPACTAPRSSVVPATRSTAARLADLGSLPACSAPSAPPPDRAAGPVRPAGNPRPCAFSPPLRRPCPPPPSPACAPSFASAPSASGRAACRRRQRQAPPYYGAGGGCCCCGRMCRQPVAAPHGGAQVQLEPPRPPPSPRGLSVPPVRPMPPRPRHTVQ